MDSLRVNSGIKNVEVNDNGDCISIPISDTSFFERFGALIKNFEKKQAEIEQQGKELSEKHKDKPDDDVDMTVDTIDLYAKLCKGVCAELDNLFGEGYIF